MYFSGVKNFVKDKAASTKKVETCVSFCTSMYLAMLLKDRSQNQFSLVILAGAIGNCDTNSEGCSFQLIVTIVVLLERFELFSLK